MSLIRFLTKNDCLALNDPHSIWDNWIDHLYVDDAGHLWVGTKQGLNRYNSETEDFTVLALGFIIAPIP